MNAADIVNFLEQVPLLAGLPREGLIGLAMQTRSVGYQQNHVIIQEGATGESLLVITAGEVDIVKGYGGDEPEVIATRGRGEVVGEMSLLEDQPRFASVVCRGQVEALEIPFQAFVEAIGSDFMALRRMLAVMSLKLRQAQQGRYNDLRRRHEELAQLASLQQAFLSVVRHELMTPIANAKLALEVLQRVAVPGNEEYDPALASLGRSLNQAEQRTRAIVDYAALIEGQSEMYLQVMDFAGAARQVAAHKENEARQAGVKLAVEINDETLWVPGDRRRLAEAMAHLLDNGIKFNQAGHTTTVKVWWDDRWVYYQVSDQGAGIPPERLARAWQPFAQMSDALKRGLEGLGLGLALTQYIVKAHEGEVWGESEAGRGSRFGFRIPRQSA